MHLHGPSPALTWSTCRSSLHRQRREELGDRRREPGLDEARHHGLDRLVGVGVLLIEQIGVAAEHAPAELRPGLERTYVDKPPADPTVVVLDIDKTDVPTLGTQQLTKLDSDPGISYR